MFSCLCVEKKFETCPQINGRLPVSTNTHLLRVLRCAPGQKQIATKLKGTGSRCLSAVPFGYNPYCLSARLLFLYEHEGGLLCRAKDLRVHEYTQKLSQDTVYFQYWNHTGNCCPILESYTVPFRQSRGAFLPSFLPQTNALCKLSSFTLAYYILRQVNTTIAEHRPVTALAER